MVASRSRPKCQHNLYLALSDDWEANCHNLVDLTLAKQVDCIISTIGLLHTPNNLPEKSIVQLDADWFLKNMQINCLVNLQLLSHLTKKLSSKTTLKFIAFSARIGSLNDNYLGGWLSYRVSKAALNMGLKTVAIEWQRLFKQAILIGYHPGTVNSKLSKPFLKNVKTVLTTVEAADYLITFLPKLNPSMNGYVYDWQGKVIPF
jgi:NAD(P)-dependent dehydrogenase (short-subunit alcohol dehydrogenase family)